MVCMLTVTALAWLGATQLQPPPDGSPRAPQVPSALESPDVAWPRVEPEPGAPSAPPSAPDAPQSSPGAPPGTDTDLPPGPPEPALEPEFEDEPVMEGGIESQTREIEITTDALGANTEEDAFRHAGGREVVEGDDMRRDGASSVAEGLERTAGVRTAQGVSGQGSAPGALSVAVRGVNPRLSQRTTVLLDEIPIAMAPYGQPQQSLFPLSMFSIERIDVVRGGASVRFGPRTGGGVFNLVSRPIPQVPTVAVFSQVDQFGEAQMGTSYAGTHGRLGVRAEYGPSFGRTYRDHSDFQLHGGLLKLEHPLGRRVDLGSTTHFAWQQTELPGGLTPGQFDADPFQARLPDGSPRDRDERRGWRVGESLKLKWQPLADHEVQAIGYYTHTFRETALEQWSEGQLLIQPRSYDALGLEPRYTVRLHHRQGPYHDLSVGARGVYELATLERRTIEGIDAPMPIERSITSEANLAAYSGFIDEAFNMLDERLRLSAGLRFEYISMARRDPDQVLERRDWGFLPAASFWFGPIDHIALWAAYGRSFTPPDFVELSQEDQGAALVPEVIDSVDGGAKIRDVFGLWADLTPWFKSFQSLRDVGEEAPERIGDAMAWGVEAEAGWAPGDLWDIMGDSEVSVGYAWQRSRIVDSTTLSYQDKRLPWYPVHDVWADLAYSFPWECALGRDVVSPEGCRALTIGGGVERVGTQFTEFTNSSVENGSGTAGPIDPYTLGNVFASWQAVLPMYWRLELTIGLKNVADRRWFERSDDINGGRMPQRPRTFYANLGLTHSFVRAWERAQERRERRRTARQARRDLPSRALGILDGRGARRW